MRLLIPLAALLVALVLVQSALAQDTPAEAAPETVSLHGWTLPEGTVITTSHRTLRHAAHGTFAAGHDPADTLAVPMRELMIYTLRADSVYTTIARVAPDGPAVVEEVVVISDILEDVREGDQVLEQRRYPEPLSGTQYALERTADGWTGAFLRGEPTEEQRRALASAEPMLSAALPYPERPIPVGETWSVERETIEALYGPTVEGTTARLTIALDSVSTFLGRPAAFLSHGLSVTLDQGEGRTMQRNEVGTTVRLLDAFVDVIARRQGTFRSTAPVALEGGTTGIAVLRGSVAANTERLLSHVPASARHEEPRREHR